MRRDIDHAATAFADPLEQFKTAECLTDGFIRWLGGEVEFDSRAWNLGLCGQQRFGLVVGGEQGVKALAQGGIAFAHGVEKCGALISGFRQSQLEQEFFASWVHGCLISAFSFASAASISASEGTCQERRPSPLSWAVKVWPSGENAKNDPATSPV